MKHEFLKDVNPIVALRSLHENSAKLRNRTLVALGSLGLDVMIGFNTQNPHLGGTLAAGSFIATVAYFSKWDQAVCQSDVLERILLRGIEFDDREAIELTQE